MKGCLVASVPHTGTNTMLCVLEREYPHVVHLPSIMKGKYPLFDPTSGRPGLHPEIPNLVWGHFNEENMPYLHHFSHYFPIFVPLRDPLASLISRWQRKVPIDHLVNTIHAWGYLAIFADTHKNIQFYPIEDFTAARGAKVMNTIGDYDLKWRVIKRDYAYIRSVLPKDIINALENLEGRLRPLLESHGYRDLLWWRK